MFRREVYEKIGGYRPGLIVSEDYDFIMRASDHFKLHILTDVLGEYRLHMSSVSVKKRYLIDRCRAEVKRAAELRRQNKAGKDAKDLRPIEWGMAEQKASADELFKQRRILANEYYGLACVYLARRRYEKALSCYVKSLGVIPWFFKSWVGLTAAGLRLPPSMTGKLFKESYERVTASDTIMKGVRR